MMSNPILLFLICFASAFCVKKSSSFISLGSSSDSNSNKFSAPPFHPLDRQVCQHTGLLRSLAQHSNAQWRHLPQHFLVGSRRGSGCHCHFLHCDVPRTQDHSHWWISCCWSCILPINSFPLKSRFAPDLPASFTFKLLFNSS